MTIATINDSTAYTIKVARKQGELVVEGFVGDYYVAQAGVDFNGGETAVFGVRYRDATNGYRVTLNILSEGVSLEKVVDGVVTTLGGGVAASLSSVRVAIDDTGELSGGRIRPVR